ncbi:MAG: tetratricopeptide repeat protein [Bacteroidales bacterium]|nr:tetratricopeptide repeat protein [Bacteroidales bacterium]
MNSVKSVFGIQSPIKIIILIIVLILPGIIRSQSENAILNQGKTEPSVESDSINFAIKLKAKADSLLEDMHYLEAENTIIQAYGIAKRFNDKKLLGKLCNGLAECYSMTGRHEKAEELYNEAFQLYSSIPDTNAMAVILINLGDEYAKTGRTELAAETELKAIKLKEDSRNYRKLAFYYQKLGELFIERDNAKWEEYAMKALALTRTPEYTTLYATVAVYNDLGAIWRIKDDFVKAEAYYDTMYRISEEAGYKKGIATATSERALLLYDQGKYQEALPVALKAYGIIEDSNDDYKIVYEATLIARILLKLNKPAEAIAKLIPALVRAEKADLVPEILEARKYLSRAYQDVGNYQMAYEIQNKWISLKDSLDGIEVRQALDDLQTRFETEKKQQLINRLNDLNLEHERRNTLFITLLVVSTVALLLLVFLLRLRNKSIRQNRFLHEKEQEIMHIEHVQLVRDLEYKSRELTMAAVHLINKNEVLNDLKSKLSGVGDKAVEMNHVIRLIDQNLNLDKDSQNFNRHFEEVHPDFFMKLKDKFPSISNNEERLCAYLYINMNTKEISQMLNVTIAAVDKGRNRLRKKLDIGSEVNLNEFLKRL